MDRRGIAATTVFVAALGVSGCAALGLGARTAASPEVHPSELARAPGPCPDELPVGDDPSGHGLGTEDDATTHPSLLEAQDAWLCRYDPVEASTGDAGTVWRWERAGDALVVPATALPGLRSALDGLLLDNPDDGCTSDLGPRWMVVSSHDGDLTGVVVDGFGCHWVRFTDDPHHTAPGADEQEGTVGGVLYGGRAVLAALGVEQP